MRHSKYVSWNLYPRHKHAGILTDLNGFISKIHGRPNTSLIPFGNGRSYGDMCLNDQNWLFDTSKLNSIQFDQRSGIVICGAGVTLKEILVTTMPHGWMLPVVPGTKEVTVGGAIANDVHGKNHHVMGSFGNHLTSLDLFTSDNLTVTCGPNVNSGLFEATIGGLGLTGLITKATIRLIKVPSAYLDVRNIGFSSISEFIRLSSEYEKDFPYSVGWLNVSKRLGSGILQLGDYAQLAPTTGMYTGFKQINLPKFIKMPGIVNNLTVRLTNKIYAKSNSKESDIKYFDDFLFPLDKLGYWNRMLFPKGFLQYQCVIPFKDADDALNEVLSIASKSNCLSFLNVIKIFGERKSQGLMSFPIQGVTVALDFFKINPKLLTLMDQMDDVVFQAGGKLYPAKDSRMSQKHFDDNFPNFKDFKPFMDPIFSSSYWRRVYSG